MKKLLLLSGMSAAMVYVGSVILGGVIRPGYSHMSEAISELVADGAPNRFLLSSLFLIYNLLLVAFGIGLFLGVKDRSRGRRSGFIGSLALMLVGLAGVAFGYARYKTDSTAAAALLHGGYNLTFFVGYLIQSR